MLTNPTIETLKALKLYGMLEALEEQQRTPTVQSLSFEERTAMLIDRERLYRDNQRRTRLLRGARWSQSRSAANRRNASRSSPSEGLEAPFACPPPESGTCRRCVISIAPPPGFRPNCRTWPFTPQKRPTRLPLQRMSQTGRRVAVAVVAR